MQTTEIEVQDGILIMTREGRKLINVKFERRSRKTGRVVMMRKCIHCGCFLEQDDNGVWRDYLDRFVCFKSMSSMHGIGE